MKIFCAKVTPILTILFLASGCGSGSSDSDPVVQPPPPPPADTTPPVITLSGGGNINHEMGSDFVDPGASATDNVDSQVNIVVSGSVGSQAGTYSLTYTATDAAGNSAQVTRTIVVADTIAPTITLSGSSSMSIAFDDTYSEPGAQAQDTVDGQITVTITGSVGAEAQNYTLTYTAIDASGNQSQVTRTVTRMAQSQVDNDVVVFNQGQVDPLWNKGINGFDSAINFGECNNDNGAACPSLSWQLVTDSERGETLEVTHSATGDLAGLYIGSEGTVDLSDYAEGSLEFDILVVSGDSQITYKIDCVYPCTSGDKNLGNVGANGWQTIQVGVADLITSGLDITKVNTGLVIWATQSTSTVFRIDNVRFTGAAPDTQPPTEPTDPNGPISFQLMPYGAGNVSDTINPASYKCVFDFGNWIYNAGIVEPAIAGCDTSTGTPSGTPTPIVPQLTAEAAEGPTPTHKWWGSVPFLGEMTIGDPNKAAYITPDPITARIHNKGVRLMGIPSGLATTNDGFLYSIPDPFSEVFDGISVGNSLHAELDAKLKSYSDGSVTVRWLDGDTTVMDATFVHGSPYVYFSVYSGQIVVKTLREDGGEKGVFYQQGNHLGVWTSVAGNHNNFLLSGEGDTQYANINSNSITVSNTAGKMTLTLLPTINGVADDATATFFAAQARNEVAKVNIDYTVDRQTNEVTVTHQYVDESDTPVSTLAGLHPLHWKHSGQTTSDYQTRSGRGVIKFAQTDGFSYTLPYVGVLPSLPNMPGSLDTATLTALIDDFIDQGSTSWNTRKDVYWSGKNYSKVAELIAIAESYGLTTRAQTLRDWLKSELQDWFTAGSEESLDEEKYFVYDATWSTLLGMEESFASHQQLNDHHFHYGYLVRAAAEICRAEPNWCSAEQYGPMVELLIRDYAGPRDDPMFPYLRNFDPANGFSWASGVANFVRGNNNESTSEAANAYGAMVLYGLITQNDELTERGMYLHASTAASYWQYWNNIDGYNNLGADFDNFPSGYDKITTSIIWGDGAVFSTWFSAAFAHILGIQGLPTNTLVFHVSLYSDYMSDYVTLGLSESANGKPSGLSNDQWRDLWWNLWAMEDADSAITDYNGVGSYEPEAGETKAHTYQWIHAFAELGQIATGTGQLSADYPAAVAFDKNGQRTYIIYNFADTPLTVNFTDGQVVSSQSKGFTVITP